MHCHTDAVFRGEADDPESPRAGGSGPPRENSTSSVSKRLAKRYDPYDNSSKSQRRARSRTEDNSTSGEGVRTQGGQSRDDDSPLPSPTTPSISTGGIDPNSYPNYHGVHGVQAVPVQAANYYHVPGFFSPGTSSQAVSLSSFPVQMNGNLNHGNVNGEHSGPSYALVATNGTPVHLGSVMSMPYYPPAVWRRQSSGDDEDHHRQGEAGSQELNTSH